MALPFIDVGDSQGSVDWDRVRNGGKAVIAACKTTEGGDFRATTFSRARVNAIHKAGLPLMPYHYLRPRTDRHGSKEAEFALAVLDDAGWRPRTKRFKRGPDLPIVMDIEQHLNEPMLAKMSGAELLHYAGEFAGTVFEAVGRGVMTYVSPGFMPELGNRAPAHGEDVWVAAFSFQRGKPPTPAGFSKSRVRAHQFSEHGTFPGVRTGETVKAIKAFQRGYVGAPPVDPLVQDGLVGPKTEKALRASAAKNGLCSEHFRFKEFASSHTGAIRTHRELVIGLEKLRAHIGRPIGVLSGFRDFNLGASMSQHKFGNAMDPTELFPTVQEVAALKVFSGIGHSPGSDRVRHVDVRHVGPNTTPGASKSRPEIFIDAF